MATSAPVVWLSDVCEAYLDGFTAADWDKMCGDRSAPGVNGAALDDFFTAPKGTPLYVFAVANDATVDVVVKEMVEVADDEGAEDGGGGGGDGSAAAGAGDGESARSPASDAGSSAGGPATLESKEKEAAEATTAAAAATSAAAATPADSVGAVTAALRGPAPTGGEPRFSSSDTHISGDW